MEPEANPLLLRQTSDSPPPLVLSLHASDGKEGLYGPFHALRAEALTKAGFDECIEATVRLRRLSFAGGVVARMGDNSRQKTGEMPGELDEGARYPGGRDFD